MADHSLVPSDGNTDPAKLTVDEIQTHRRDLRSKAHAFELARPVTEEEFDQALDWVFNYLMFDVTTWQGELIQDPQLRRELPMLSSIPLYCRGRGEPEVRDGEPTGKFKNGCRYYNVCPVMRKLKLKDQEELVGTPCRVDQYEGVKNFSAQAKEMHLTPGDMSSIITVAQITRLLIQLRRIDWELALHDIAYTEIAGFSPQGAPAYEKRVNQLGRESRAIETQISRLQSQMMATRKDRATLAGSFKQDNNPMLNLFKAAVKEDMRREQEAAGEIKDAEFSDIVDEEPEDPQ